MWVDVKGGKDDDGPPTEAASAASAASAVPAANDEHKKVSQPKTCCKLPTEKKLGCQKLLKTWKWKKVIDTNAEVAATATTTTTSLKPTQQKLSNKFIFWGSHSDKVTTFDRGQNLGAKEWGVCYTAICKTYVLKSNVFYTNSYAFCWIRTCSPRKKNRVL